VPAFAPSRPKRRRRFVEVAALRAAAALALTFLCVDARAEWSGSVSVVSDYRYRGISLTGNDPALQGTIDYDDPSGFYAGAFASNVKFAFSSGREAQLLSFAGYARQLPSGLTIDAGVDYSLFSRTHDYDYPEIYCGFASGNISGRVYYSPRYFGRFGDAVYGEVNVAQPLTDKVRLVAHGGVLHSSYENAYAASTSRATFDGRIAVSFDVDGFNVEVGLVGVTSAQSAYPFAGNARRNGVVATLTRSF
jgi:uncharacterized protein (TIGR02001 family)